MADVVLHQGQSLPENMRTRYVDMGDGTWAPVVSATVAAGAVVDVSDRIGRLVGRITNYDVLVNGTLGALDEYVEIDCSGLGTVGIGISGTWAGTITAYIQVGDAVWDTIPLIDNTLGSAGLSTTVNGNFVVGVSGALALRLVMSPYTSGTATVYLEGTSAAGGVFLTRSLPTGVNTIGLVGINAGANHIGSVGGHCYTVDANPVLTVAGAYVAGDYVGTSTTAITFTNAVRIAQGSGVIESAVLVDKALQSADLELWLFDTAPTPPADNAAWTISDADALTCIGIIPFDTYYASALNSISVATGLGMVINAAAGTRDIYGCLVTRGTPTYASLDLLIRLQILGD